MKNAAPWLLLALACALPGCSVIGYDLDQSRQTPNAARTAAVSTPDSAMEIGTQLDYVAGKKLIDGVARKPDPVPFEDVPECASTQTKVCSALEGCRCITSKPVVPR